MGMPGAGVTGMGIRTRIAVADIAVGMDTVTVGATMEAIADITAGDLATDMRHIITVATMGPIILIRMAMPPPITELPITIRGTHLA
jgi:hypothetical protein